MYEFFYALILAVVLSSLLIGTGRRGPGLAAGFVFYFILFLLFGWAASLWLAPAGNPVGGVYWVSPLAAVVLMTLILFAIIPADSGRIEREEEIRERRETPRETRNRHAVEAGVGLFFWLAVFGLLGAIVAGAS